MLLLDNNTIQSLWIGKELTLMEEMSIRSFIKNGHIYHLYTYGEMGKVPDGTVIKDGNDILPNSRIFRYGAAAQQGEGSYSGFSNLFRYALLKKHGGYWVDADVICLRKFDFKAKYVFSSEVKHFPENTPTAASCVIKCPAGSDWATYCYKASEHKDTQSLKWGEIGPILVQESINNLGLSQHMLPYNVFCPIHYFEVEKIIGPNSIEFGPEVYALHLWNEMWSRKGFDKNGNFPKTSIYEILKSKYIYES